MRHEYDNLFQYGLKGGKLVHIDDVENGIKCGCECPECDEPLIAYNNPKNKRARHFQHHSLKDCAGVYETVIHLLAKEIIQEQGYLIVPDIDYVLSEYAWTYDTSVTQSSEKVTRAKRIQFDRIEMEKSVGAFRPDLKCSISGKTIYIEIAVTHFIDQEKKEKIFRDGNPVLEIDLSGEKRILSKSALSTLLSTQIDKMKWINNPKIWERFLHKESVAREIKAFISRNKRTLKVYGKNHNVYNCPIYKEYYDKIKVEDECQRCRCFVTEWEGGSNLGDKPRYEPRTVDCIGHVSKEYVNLLKTKGIYVKDI